MFESLPVTSMAGWQSMNDFEGFGDKFEGFGGKFGQNWGKFKSEWNNSHGHGFDPNCDVVPLPASAWLFGSALFGLGWVRSRRKVTI